MVRDATNFHYNYVFTFLAASQQRHGNKGGRESTPLFASIMREEHPHPSGSTVVHGGNPQDHTVSPHFASPTSYLNKRKVIRNQAISSNSLQYS
ncbi:hypothetical protein NIES267_11330 [Calothrix parasitica NIES-267]|uniref:Uncharacterized protein n=1 Tax=Calothrix parasitica NIES-267 TaxID=1973488 RepID=A0A1Z4LKA6_9CYAN|nr:hypothetical protein NIES267_11330 [Calothrix parasitica NIES-267]